MGRNNKNRFWDKEGRCDRGWARNSEELEARRKRSLVVWGLLLMAVGVLFLAKNFGLVDFAIPGYLFSWKLVFVFFGINFFIHQKYMGGSIMMILAFFFFSPELLGHDIVELRKKLWPIIPILIGLAMFLRLNKKKRVLDLSKTDDVVSENTPEEEKSNIDTTIVFGGASKKINSYDFKGGKITTVFGGLELDLTNCILSNNRAEIEITSVMGGVSLAVPREWNVILDVVPVLGGVEDNIRDTPQAYVDPAAELYIKGTVVMGGIEINRI
jgi:predicted membrane protein